jgi:hypothetical protein
MSPKAGGGGSCGTSANEYWYAVHRSPNKLWRSNSLLNLWVVLYSCTLYVVHVRLYSRMSYTTAKSLIFFPFTVLFHDVIAAQRWLSYLTPLILPNRLTRCVYVYVKNLILDRKSQIRPCSKLLCILPVSRNKQWGHHVKTISISTRWIYRK